MALDASIYQGIQPVRPANPLANYAQALQVQGLQADADKAARDERTQAAVADAYRGAVGADGAIDRNKLLTSIAGAGAGAQIPGIQKGFLEQDKAKNEALKAQYEQQLQKFDVAARIMSGVTDQPSWERARQQTAQVFGPEAAAQMPLEYNPQLIAENKQKAMAVKDQIEASYKQLTLAETQRHNTATEANAADAVSATMRGQDMTDARQRDANNISQQGKTAENTTNLRKEFTGLQEVKNYQLALPAFRAIEDAAKRNTPQSDINLVYGIAKLYDPNSVVREGEYNTVANSPNIPERVKGWVNYITNQGGKLTPATKQQILDEARGRMQTFQTEYEGKRNQYQDIAQRTGADSTLVLDNSYDSPVKPRKTIGGVTYENDGKGWYKVGK